MPLGQLQRLVVLEHGQDARAVRILELLLDGAFADGVAVLRQFVGHALGAVLVVHFQHEQARADVRAGEVEDAIRDDAGAVGQIDLGQCPAAGLGLAAVGSGHVEV